MALTDAQKRELIEQRLQHFETEKFQHELNRELAQALGNDSANATALAAIQELDTAIAVHQDALNNLEN